MFVTDYLPPEKRRSSATGGIERRFTEAAVQLAFALHLLEQAAGEPATVYVHPDGEHAKIFEIPALLAWCGFQRVAAVGKTPYGGCYERGTQVLIVHPRSGQGDVVGLIAGQRIVAECKGAVINSTHNGQRSRTRKGMSELIGQLMMRDAQDERQVAVLPATADTRRLAPVLSRRCRAAGIEIALVEEDGSIHYVEASR